MIDIIEDTMAYTTVEHIEAIVANTNIVNIPAFLTYTNIITIEAAVLCKIWIYYHYRSKYKYFK